MPPEALDRRNNEVEIALDFPRALLRHLDGICDAVEQRQRVLVLAAFGIYLFRKNPTRALKPSTEPSSNNYITDTITGFLLTFSNPLILFFIIGLFARFNFILPEYGTHHYIIGYAMIFTGALLWWYMVTTLVNLLRRRFNVRSLWLINRIIGGVLILMAVVGVFMAIRTHYFA